METNTPKDGAPGTPKDGAPGTTDQSPRWEGPKENRPPGYLPAEDDPDRTEDANGETNADPETKRFPTISSRKANEMSDVEKDAKGQFAKSVGDRKATGVASAKPTVVTASEDATVHKTPPGKKPVKEWDLNYAPADTNEGEAR